VRGESSALSPPETQAVTEANVIVYDPALAPLITELLPPGTYAEPMAATALDKTFDERALRFARDGWNVVQLNRAGNDLAPPRRRVRAAAEQLITAGASPETPVFLVTQGTRAVPLTSETRLRTANTVIDDHGLGVTPMIVFGPSAGGPAPQSDTFTANGLAG
jgi:siroheme synthase